MKNWMILHRVEDYEHHPDYIGKEGKEPSSVFKRIKKGDNILYYCYGDMVFAGVFKVVSKIIHWTDDKYWKGSLWVYKIKSIYLAPAPRYIGIDEMLSELFNPLELFPKRKVEGVKLKGKTAISLTNKDFKIIANYIKHYKPKTSTEFHGMSNDEGLGEPLDLGIMNYAPTSEAGVVVLFAHFLKELGFEKIEFIRSGFPDACVLQKVGNTFHRKYIEFEYHASSFKQHVKNPKHSKYKCDYVVCWENDFKTCPVPAIELKSELGKIIG